MVFRPILIVALVFCAPVYSDRNTPLRQCDLARLVDEADAPTADYLRLLHYLATDRGLLDADVLGALAKSDGPVNPIDLAGRKIDAVAALPFHQAFARALERKVEWARVREAARRMLGEREVVERRRGVARGDTSFVLAPFVTLPSLPAEFGDKPEIMPGPDGALFILPSGSSDRVLRIVGNRATPIAMPKGAHDAKLVRSIDGKRLFAACRVDENGRIVLVDLVHGGRTTLAEVESSIFETHLALDGDNLIVIRGTERLSLPFDGGAPTTSRIEPCEYWTSPRGRVLALAIRGEDVRVSDLASGQTLHEEKIAWPKTNVSAYHSVLREDDEGNVYFIGQNAKHDLLIRDLTRGRRQDFPLGHAVHGIPVVTGQSLLLPTSHAALGLMRFDLKAGGDPTSALATTAGNRSVFRTAAGETFLARVRWSATGGQNSLMLEIQNAVTGEVSDYSLGGTGVKFIVSVEMLSDDRVVLVGKDDRGEHRLMQLYGPPQRKNK